MDDRSIAFFDSGLGGLSIALAARRAMPSEHFVYVGDCANAPYGDKSPAFIRRRVTAIASRLFESGRIKALVLACNTATAEAADALRTAMPDRLIFGVEPAIKPAAMYSKTGKIGMISTTRTASSRRYAELIAHHASGVTVYSRGCPGLMEEVEAGRFDGTAVRTLLHRYLDDMLEAGIDALVLGCTHYPFLKGAIEAVAGPGVKIYVPDAAVAGQVRRVLEARSMAADGTPEPDAFLISGLDAARRATVAELYPFEKTLSELTF